MVCLFENLLTGPNIAEPSTLGVNNRCRADDCDFLPNRGTEMFQGDTKELPKWAIPAGIMAFVCGVTVMVIDHWATIRAWFSK
jgi:hypothetical protein